MVIVGVDAHKRTHTLVAADDVGRELASKTVAATPEGHLEAVEWAARWPERKFALEDCRHVTRRLERDLLAAGEAVVRVPTRLMAGERRGGRRAASRTRSTALADRARRVREPNLPVAHLDGETRELRLLVDHREDLVRERTRIQSRLRWHLHELFPGLVIRPKSLRCFKVLDELDVRLDGVDGTVAEIARELVARTRELTGRANALERQITQIVRRVAPTLLALPGCGVLSAAKIVGETAGASRFRSTSACRAGTARRLSRCGRAVPTANGSTAAATVRSTRRCIASRSRNGVASARAAGRMSSSASRPATARPKRCVCFAAGSPTKCSAASSPTRTPTSNRAINALPDTRTLT